MLRNILFFIFWINLKKNFISYFSLKASTGDQKVWTADGRGFYAHNLRWPYKAYPLSVTSLRSKSRNNYFSLSWKRVIFYFFFSLFLFLFSLFKFVHSQFSAYLSFWPAVWSSFCKDVNYIKIRAKIFCDVLNYSCINNMIMWLVYRYMFIILKHFQCWEGYF